MFYWRLDITIPNGLGNGCVRFWALGQPTATQQSAEWPQFVLPGVFCSISLNEQIAIGWPRGVEERYHVLHLV